MLSENYSNKYFKYIIKWIYFGEYWVDFPLS